MDVLQKITIEVRGEPPTPVDGEWLGDRLAAEYGVEATWKTVRS